MTGLRERLRLSREDGFTLVELSVATAVLSLILVAIGGLMYSTTMTQRTVTASTESASTAQTAADGIRTQIRNAAEFRLTAVGSTDQLLIARVAGTGTTATYLCRAWYFAGGSKQLRSTTWAVAGTTALPTSASSVSTWGLVLEGVHPRPSSTVIFKPPVGGTFEVAFEVDAERGKPTAIEFTAALAGGQGGGNTCWD